MIVKAVSKKEKRLSKLSYSHEKYKRRMLKTKVLP